jgi:hypothetical protein
MAPNYKERIKPVDPERFQFALGVFNAAADMKGPYPNPEQFAVNLIEDDGSISRLSLTDRPENRGMMALKKEFPDSQEFQCIGFRILTLPEVIRDRKLVAMGLIREGENGVVEIHDAVVTALAGAPFRKSGTLDKDAFLALAQTEYERMEADKIGGPS